MLIQRSRFLARESFGDDARLLGEGRDSSLVPEGVLKGFPSADMRRVVCLAR